MEDNIFKKVPNWLRYVLAIPLSIICVILAYYIMYFSERWIASPDSLYITISTFLYQNGLNVFIMVYSMNYILPKYQFQFTLTISILLCGLGFIGFGMSIIAQTLTITYIIGFILTIVSFIAVCYLTYRNYVKNPTLEAQIIENNETPQNLINSYEENGEKDESIKL